MVKKPEETKTPEEIGMEVITAMDHEFHEQSDRIVAIVGAAYLDSTLDSLLRAAFIDARDEVDRLFRPDAPLGSNGSRCQLAYCLGLITCDQRDDLKIIAKIRNVFAHDFKALSFDTPQVRDFCASFQQPEHLAAMPEKIFSPDTAKHMKQYVREITATPREKFRMSVIGLFGSLLRRINYMKRVKPGIWFSYDPDAQPGHPNDDA